MLDPFNSGPAKNIKPGVLLDDLLDKGLLKSDEIGKKHRQDFILKRIKIKENDATSFFAPIKNPKLKTKVAKEISPEEVYSYSLTTLPFALSDPSGKLQQSQKVQFRNYLISEFKSARKEVTTGADLIYDGIAVVRAIPIKST